MTPPDRHESARDPDDLARFFIARFNEGDVEGLVALYEPTAALATGDSTVAQGTQEIREFYTKLLERGRTIALGTQRPALRHGDHALTSTRLPSGTTTAEVAHRQADGTWRWIIDQPRIAPGTA